MMSADEAALLAQGLSRRYGTTQAVDSFSLSVAPGEVVVLVGPNGCGKTTSIEMSLGFRSMDAGSSRIFGFDPAAKRRALSRIVGVQPQGAGLHPRVRVREQIEFIGAAYGTKRSAFALAEAMGLGPALDATCGSLSGGMQRRALVLSALAGLPRLAVLDEPTSGVDPESRLQLWSVIRTLVQERGTAMLVSSHDLVEAQRYGDRVAVMRAGRVIADDTPRALLAQADIARVICLRGYRYVTPALVEQHGGKVLTHTADEMVTAFDTRTRAGDFHARLQEVDSQASVTEREPTLEDIYFLLASNTDKGGER